MTREGYLRWKDTDVFKHWGNGGEIESYDELGGWFTLDKPAWNEDVQYRIKPKPAPKEYTKQDLISFAKYVILGKVKDDPFDWDGHVDMWKDYLSKQEK